MLGAAGTMTALSRPSLRCVPALLIVPTQVVLCHGSRSSSGSCREWLLSLRLHDWLGYSGRIRPEGRDGRDMCCSSAWQLVAVCDWVDAAGAVA